MEVLKEPLPGLLVIKPEVYKDKRGFFLETWQKERYKDIGIQEEFVQDNWSRSTKGVLRGLHFQNVYPQGKLVSVKRGEIIDVAVDIRKESDSFGRHHSEVLNDENHLQLYIPPGFAHGFCVLSDKADFNYKCTNFYFPEYESGILWDDEYLNINWKVKHPLISDKDSQLKSFRSFFKI